MENSNIDTLMLAAQQATAKGDLQKAVVYYEELLTKNPENLQALRQLIHCKYDMQDYSGAASLFNILQSLYPQDPKVYAEQSDLYLLAGEINDAIKPYKKLVSLQPHNTTAHFNLARLLAKAEQDDRAFRHFEKCLKFNIDRPEEVLLNQATLMVKSSRHFKAIQLLKNAINLAPNYAEAYFNLATIEEELGNKKKAIQYYKKVLEVDPGFSFGPVFERLAIAGAFSDPEDSLLRSAELSAEEKRLDPAMAENLNYGLGKCFDDLNNHEKAYSYYKKANLLSKKRVGEYGRDAMEAYVDQVINTFTPQWISSNKLDNSHQPIFIMGMFRSGSTLLEQVLSQHPKIACGGEISYFRDKLNLDGKHLADSIVNKKAGFDLHQIARGYIDTLTKNHGRISRVTDKRPDNFLYIGLIKTLFPEAKLIITRRKPLDNILSVYFQHFGKDLPYANDLGSIAHFYSQFDRLSHHWQQAFAGDIYEIEYENFVNNQQESTAKLLDYCNLNWHQPCMDFHKSTNAVNTASVWQVRKRIYTSSVNRNLHYDEFLDSAKEVLSRHGIAF